VTSLKPLPPRCRLAGVAPQTALIEGTVRANPGGFLAKNVELDEQPSELK